MSRYDYDNLDLVVVFILGTVVGLVLMFVITLIGP